MTVLASPCSQVAPRLLAVVVAALFVAPSASAQTTITLANGQTNATAYDTTAPTGPLTFDVGSGAATQSGALSGSGSIIKTGAGTLTLAATHPFSGGTTINAGTLAVSAVNQLGSGSISVGNGGRLDGGSASFNFN